jgi:hypothetical protein
VCEQTVLLLGSGGNDYRHRSRNAHQVRGDKHDGLAFGISNRRRASVQVVDLAFRRVSPAAVAGHPHELGRRDDNSGDAGLPGTGAARGIARSISSVTCQTIRQRNQKHYRGEQYLSHDDFSIAGRDSVAQHSESATSPK